MRLTREVFDECRERALSLLDRRAHSVGQLRAKLLKRGFAEALVTLVTDDLCRTGLLDDQQFAVAFCEERLNGSNPAGRRRLKAELLRRQVPAELAEEALRAVLEGAGNDSEYTSALQAGRRKWSALQARPGSEPRQDRDRLLRFLAGRGFSADIGYRVAAAVASGEDDDSDDDDITVAE